MMNKAPASM